MGEWKDMVCSSCMQTRSSHLGCWDTFHGLSDPKELEAKAVKKSAEIMDDPKFYYAYVCEEELSGLWRNWRPRGPGETGAMVTVTKLIEAIAHMRGFDTSKWES